MSSCQKYNTKEKQSDTKQYIMYNSIYMTLEKSQN